MTTKRHFPSQVLTNIVLLGVLTISVRAQTPSFDAFDFDGLTITAPFSPKLAVDIKGGTDQGLNTESRRTWLMSDPNKRSLLSVVVGVTVNKAGALKTAGVTTVHDYIDKIVLTQHSDANPETHYLREIKELDKIVRDSKISKAVGNRGVELIDFAFNAKSGRRSTQLQAIILNGDTVTEIALPYILNGDKETNDKRIDGLFNVLIGMVRSVKLTKS